MDKKIKSILAGMEELQASNKKKDDLIANLESKMVKLEADSLMKSEEISRLSRELESVKKSKTDPATPVLHGCTVETRRMQLGGKNSITQNNNVKEKKEKNSSQVAKEGRHSMHCTLPKPSTSNSEEEDRKSNFHERNIEKENINSYTKDSSEVYSAGWADHDRRQNLTT